MLIKNANLITCDDNNRILSGAALKITPDGTIDRIIERLDPNDLAAETDDIIDANNQYVMPGQICAHPFLWRVFPRYVYPR